MFNPQKDNHAETLAYLIRNLSLRDVEELCALYKQEWREQLNGSQSSQNTASKRTDDFLKSVFTKTILTNF